ncbi:AsmA family protein [Edaphobacter bradus]|uniref:AsmA family protein n=1 Tax=Edaphobacter bradus TaxID=2259016 RepID=UPI0021DF854C|nr:AsmA family protein [Edaphobacter bradus]
MQKIDPTEELKSGEGTGGPRALLRHLRWIALGVLALLLLVLLPPFINVNRFQRRIATSISGSLGRPVHLDRVSLSLLPLPGFTLENFVVSEDPAFGSEPIIRANEVRATLRISSLWRRRVEFSTISFTEPSVNLVHMPDGKWNIESILLQASRIAAAPTAQEKAGPAPRFPYIEATGARLNVKEGAEKTPYSLTDAEFALWLPNPEQWRLRLQGKPMRTDTSVSDTGTLRLEAMLGRARSLGEVPIELTGSWRGAPLGEASKILFASDAGWRGDLALETTIKGTMDSSVVVAQLRLNDARLAEFVPEQALAVDLECRGQATQLFHSLTQVRCSWPPGEAQGKATLAVSGSVPDVRQWRASTLEAGVSDVPASALVAGWHVVSTRVPAGVAASGTLTGSLSFDGLKDGQAQAGRWAGELVLANASLKTATDGPSLVTGDVALRSPERPTMDPRGRRRHASPTPPASEFLLEPVKLALGGKEPALMDGRVDESGYMLHLTGMASTARLLALAKAVPQIGDGLPEALPTDRAAGPFRVDLTATRQWGEAQVWRDNTARPVAPSRKRPRR